jgi:adenylate kinase family enzyme
VLPYYKKQGRLHTIHGIGAIDEIFNAICAHLDKKQKV